MNRLLSGFFKFLLRRKHKIWMPYTGIAVGWMIVGAAVMVLTLGVMTLVEGRYIYGLHEIMQIAGVVTAIFSFWLILNCIRSKYHKVLWEQAEENREELLTNMLGEKNEGTK